MRVRQMLLMFFVWGAFSSCFSQVDPRIEQYNQYFGKKDFVNALLVAEELVASYPLSLDCHREKAKMLAATNQREAFFQQMKLLRNKDSSSELTVFFAALSHELVDKTLREDLRRFYFSKKDTDVLIRWPSIDKYETIDSKIVVESQGSEGSESSSFNSEQTSQFPTSSFEATNSTNQASALPVQFKPLVQNWPASSLTPLAPFQWSDNMFDVFRKLKTIPTINAIYVDISDISNDAIKLSDSDFVTKTMESVKAFLDQQEQWGEFENGLKIILPNGKESYLISLGSQIQAESIILANIPFKAHINFTHVPGMLLANPGKAFRILGKKQEVYVSHALYMISLSPLDLSLAEHNQAELFKVISTKYPVLKSEKWATWDGKSPNDEFFSTQDGDCSFSFWPKRMMISYNNSLKSLDKKYEEHRNNILSKKNQESDMSSGL